MMQGSTWEAPDVGEKESGEGQGGQADTPRTQDLVQEASLEEVIV